jgi:hypothetical protein
VTNDLVKQTEYDEFSGCVDTVEGGDEPSFDRGVSFIKFSAQGEWMLNDEELPQEREYMVAGVKRSCVRWPQESGPPEETILLEPGQKWPDTDEWNAAIPKDEWRTDAGGNPKGPWERTYTILLMDVDSMDRFRFATATIGGGIAIRDIATKIANKRKFSAVEVLAVVRLSTMHMKTKFGGRDRPHFEVIKWITFDGSEPAELPPPPAQPQLEKTVTANGQRKYGVSTGVPAESKPQAKAKGARVLAEPTLSEEMQDKIPM